MAQLPEFSKLSTEEKDVLIQTLLVRLDEAFKRIAAFEAENATLREENATLREENATLREENKALREKLNQPPKTPNNSSKPPSQDQKPNQDSQARSKRNPHPGAHRELHPNPTREHSVLAERCEHCDADVRGTAQSAQHAYDRIEIPKIEPDVTRVLLMGGTCPCCQQRFKAKPPVGLEPGSPFGPNLRAFVLYLRFRQAIPFERLARSMFDLFGLAISEGALANMLADSAPAFAEQAGGIRARLLAGTALESDETGMRVGKKKYWTWVFHHGDSACFVTRFSRGKDVVQEFLGDWRPEFWVSDRLGSQMGWATKGHQACLAHLIRDTQYAIDCGDAVFAPAILKLLKEATGVGQRRPDLADATLKAYLARLENKLDSVLKKTPKGEAGEKLKGVIKKYRQNLFVFVTNRYIPATNNGSEQALRPCVVFRKVTNCFRSQWRADLYADVRSVFETARRRGIGILDAIQMTLDKTPLPTTG